MRPGVGEVERSEALLAKRGVAGAYRKGEVELVADAKVRYSEYRRANAVEHCEFELVFAPQYFEFGCFENVDYLPVAMDVETVHHRIARSGIPDDTDIANLKGLRMKDDEMLGGESGLSGVV